MPEYPQEISTRRLTELFGGETTNGVIGNRVRRLLVSAANTKQVAEGRIGRLSYWIKLPNKQSPKGVQMKTELPRAPASPDISYEDVLKLVPFFPNRITTLEIVRLCGGDSTVSPFSHKIRRRLMKGVDNKHVFTAFELGQSFWWRREPETKEPKKTGDTPVVTTPILNLKPPVSKTAHASGDDIRKDMAKVLLTHIRKGALPESELLVWARVVLNTAEIQFTDPQLKHVLKLIWGLDWQS